VGFFGGEHLRRTSSGAAMDALAGHLGTPLVGFALGVGQVDELLENT
jgi:hypothetical protein